VDFPSVGFTVGAAPVAFLALDLHPHSTPAVFPPVLRARFATEAADELTPPNKLTGANAVGRLGFYHRDFGDSSVAVPRRSVRTFGSGLG